MPRDEDGVEARQELIPQTPADPTPPSNCDRSLERDTAPVVLDHPIFNQRGSFSIMAPTGTPWSPPAPQDGVGDVAAGLRGWEDRDGCGSVMVLGPCRVRAAAP